MNCPSCGSEVEAGSKYCEECGVEIVATMAAPTQVPAQVPAAAAAAVANQTPDVVLAPPPMPATSMPAMAQNTMPPPVMQSAQPQGTNQLANPRFVEAVSGRELALTGSGGVVGRSDAGEGWMPTFDLVPFGGGPEAGVSRRHANLTIQGGQVLLADNSSANGTFVNGQQLGNTPRQLADGDQVRVGRVTLIFRI